MNLETIVNFIKENWRGITFYLVIIFLIGRCVISQPGNDEVVSNEVEEVPTTYDSPILIPSINCSDYNPPVEFDINYLREYWECGGEQEIAKREELYSKYEKEMDYAFERFFNSLNIAKSTNDITISNLPIPPIGYCGKYKKCIDGKYDFRFSEDYIDPYAYDEYDRYTPEYDDRWLDEYD